MRRLPPGAWRIRLYRCCLPNYTTLPHRAVHSTVLHQLPSTIRFYRCCLHNQTELPLALSCNGASANRPMLAETLPSLSYDSHM